MVYLAASCGLPTCPCGARDSWRGSRTFRPPARALEHKPPRWDSNPHGQLRTNAEEKTRDKDRRPRQGAPSRPEHTGVSDQRPFLTHLSTLSLSFGASLFFFSGRSGFPLAGARVRCSPFAHWAEETLHALFWSRAPILGDGSPAHVCDRHACA